jgi:hypothetical protein
MAMVNKFYYITVDDNHPKRVGFWLIKADSLADAKFKAVKILGREHKVYAYKEATEMPTFNQQLFWGELKCS